MSEMEKVQGGAGVAGFEVGRKDHKPNRVSGFRRMQGQGNGFPLKACRDR